MTARAVVEAVLVRVLKTNVGMFAWRFLIKWMIG